ncbi:MAG: TetR family transcriptional regulator [Thermodesulfobacteriota bacterium]|nr:TetR family transcriptional regulator [Thermodesulfobacteriota bacterium]
MKKTRADALRTRRQILNAALKVFGLKGYAATTLNDIARQAGLTRGAIYWHFENKRKLYEALLKDYYRTIEEKIKTEITSSKTPLIQLKDGIFKLLNFFSDHQDYRTIEEALLGSPQVQQELAGVLDKQKQLFGQIYVQTRALIKAAIDNGEIRKGVDPDIAASAIISYVNGIKLTRLHNPLSLNNMVDQLIDLMFKGMEKGIDPR